MRETHGTQGSTRRTALRIVTLLSIALVAPSAGASDGGPAETTAPPQRTLVVLTLHGSNVGSDAPMHVASIAAVEELAASGAVDLSQVSLRHVPIVYDYHATVRRSAEQVARQLVAMKLPGDARFLIVGHSQGAYVAYWLMRHHESPLARRAALVAVDPDMDSMRYWGGLAVAASLFIGWVPELGTRTYVSAGASIATSQSQLARGDGLEASGVPLFRVETDLHAPYRTPEQGFEAVRERDLARVREGLASALGTLDLATAPRA